MGFRLALRLLNLCEEVVIRHLIPTWVEEKTSLPFRRGWMRFLTQLASRAFINHEVRIPPTDAPAVAAGNRIAFMEGSRGGFPLT
jgi:hypothetical protein